MKIGILGGGQLARMIIEENSRYGFDFHVLTKEADSPAGRITMFETVGDWNNADTVREFISNCDVITLENEFIDYHILECIENSGRKLLPGSASVKMIQDKLIQKNTLSGLGIPVADYCEVNNEEDVKNFAREQGYPVILKSRTMGYDGKGNAKIDGESGIHSAMEMLSKRGKLMCERFIEFEKEIATQAVRSSTGEFRIYPVVETVQENHICKYVIADEKGFPEIRKQAEELSRKLLESMSYAGVMGIEMFLCGDKVLVNELAPRVHNSGHYTIEACGCSQFENHIRAIAGLPLGNTELKVPAAVMINVLGKSDMVADTQGISEIMRMENVYLHLYGKKESRAGRKLGHITATGAETGSLLNKTAEARRFLAI